MSFTIAVFSITITLDEVTKKPVAIIAPVIPEVSGAIDGVLTEFFGGLEEELYPIVIEFDEKGHFACENVAAPIAFMELVQHTLTNPPQGRVHLLDIPFKDHSSEGNTASAQHAAEARG